MENMVLFPTPLFDESYIVLGFIFEKSFRRQAQYSMHSVVRHKISTYATLIAHSLHNVPIKSQIVEICIHEKTTYYIERFQCQLKPRQKYSHITYTSLAFCPFHTASTHPIFQKFCDKRSCFKRLRIHIQIFIAAVQEHMRK